jgi:hypothetical protein
VQDEVDYIEKYSQREGPMTANWPPKKSHPPERLSGEQPRVSGTHPVSSDLEQPMEEVDLTAAQQKRIAEVFSELKAVSLYDLLGAPLLADKKTIRRAYNQRAMEFHPDRFFRKRLGTFKPKMEAIFARMTEAQEVLCSPERRAQYDAALRASRASLIEVMLEQAATEMAGSAEAARRMEFSIDEPVQVQSASPGVPVPASARQATSPEKPDTSPASEAETWAPVDSLAEIAAGIADALTERSPTREASRTTTNAQAGVSAPSAVAASTGELGVPARGRKHRMPFVVVAVFGMMVVALGAVAIVKQHSERDPRPSVNPPSAPRSTVQPAR